MASAMEDAIEADEARTAIASSAEYAAALKSGISSLTTSVSKVSTGEAYISQSWDTLTSTIGDDGMNCCSVGRDGKTYLLERLNLQTMLQSMIEDPAWAQAGLKDDLIQLRENIVNYCAEEQQQLLIFHERCY